MFLRSDHLRKLAQLKTPEDIARWREERKANFPTNQKRTEAVESRNNSTATTSATDSNSAGSSSNHSAISSDRSKRPNRGRFQDSASKRRAPLTLYEKMLMTDVKREQTQLLQMIEVIVDNDFLQNNRQTDQQ